MNVSEFQRELELDEDWNPIQDSFEQSGYGAPLDERPVEGIVQESILPTYTFTYIGCLIFKAFE